MALALLAAAASGCRTSMDTTVADRMVQSGWVLIGESSRVDDCDMLRLTIDRTGWYRLAGGDVDHADGDTAGPDVRSSRGPRWCGTAGGTGPDTLNALRTRSVLRKGDRIELQWQGSEPPSARLQLLELVDLRITGEQIEEKLPYVELDANAGRWHLAVSHAAQARQCRVIEVVERAPTAYSFHSDNPAHARMHTAAEMNYMDIVMCLVCAPLHLAGLALHKHGKGSFKPHDFRSTVLGEKFEDTGTAVTYRVPVADAKYRWQLRIANTTAVAEDVSTSATGRAELDFRGYLTAIERTIDFGRTGEVDVIEVRTGRQLTFPVDLLQIRDAVRARLRSDGGRIPEASR